MRKLWIIGNSGAARECFWIFQDMLSADAALEATMAFGGFLSWRHYPSNLVSLAESFRGEALEMPVGENDLFVIGIGEPSQRLDVYQTMKARGARFFTLLHPLSDINPTAVMGEANIFQRSCSMFCDVKIGNANYLNGAVNLSHDVQAGDANFFGPFALVLGNCQVGSCNLLAVRTTLLPHVRIGDDNQITPGSIVYRGCRNGRVMTGNPAIIKSLVEHYPGNNKTAGQRMENRGLNK